MNELLADYAVRIAPGLAVIGALLLFRVRPIVRVGLYIIIFILFRDLMTPLGLWSLGDEGGLWLRIYPSGVFMVAFGVSAAAALLAIHYLDRENRCYVSFFRGKHHVLGLAIGLLTAILVVSPFFFIYPSVPIGERGGGVAASLLFPLAIFSLFGNFFEEGIFRGYVLGYLSERHSLTVAGIASGFVFAACHSFLAITVTDVGLPLLLFTVWEGILAGLVGARYGVIPATLTHGGAIFLLASGLW
jgi:hypothetical protein